MSVFASYITEQTMGLACVMDFQTLCLNKDFIGLEIVPVSNDYFIKNFQIIITY